MADLTVNPVAIAPAFLDFCKIRSFLAGATGITAGQPFYVASTGVILPTNAATAGQYQFRGIALNSGGKNQAISGLVEGFVEGFDLSPYAYDSIIFLSNNTGMLASATGTNNVQVGRICPLSDRDFATSAPSKLLYVRSDMIRNW